MLVMLNLKAIIYHELDILAKRAGDKSVKDWNFLPKMWFGSLYMKIGGSNCSFNTSFIMGPDLRRFLFKSLHVIPAEYFIFFNLYC